MTTEETFAAPKGHAFRDLLAAIPPETFEATVRAWVDAALGEAIPEAELRAIALDGKTLCGTLQPHQRAVHLLSLFDQRLGCVLSQQRVDEKTNEHKAALELLNTLVLKDCVVTGEAMFCQREICQQIIDSGGDYFLVVKENQPRACRKPSRPSFGPLSPPANEQSREAALEVAETKTKEHGRRVHRRLQSMTRLTGHLDWPGIEQVCRLTRITWRNGQEQQEVAYAITSVSRSQAEAGKLLTWWRGHWGIENRVHYVRDVTFGEDASRIRTASAPQILAAARNSIISLLRLWGSPNIAAALRENAYQPARLLAKLGILN